MSEEITIASEIEEAERELLSHPQIDCPLRHRFLPGVYCREIMMPAGTFVIGHCHRTKHFNIVLTGKALVMMNGVLEAIEAPAIFESEEGIRKVLYIVETMRWATIHLTNETDLAVLEKDLIIKSDAFTQHQLRQDAEKLRLAVSAETNHAQP